MTVRSLILFVLGTFAICQSARCEIYYDMESFRRAVEADTVASSRQSTLWFKYSFGFWPELGELRQEPILDAQLEKITKRLGLVGLDICDSAKAFVCGELNSSFLQSKYWLVWIRSSLSMLGGFRPTTFFVVDSAGTGNLKPLMSRLTLLASDFEDLLAETTQFVVLDARVEKVTTSNCLQATRDLITACCPEQPIVFLDSAFDIYTFSNAVSDSSFWSVAESDDSLITLLTSYRLEHVGENHYFADKFNDISFGWEEFAGVDTIIRPISCKENSDESIRVTVYTWSACVLTRWHLTFKTGSHLVIEYEVLDTQMGFCGFYM